MWDIAVLNNQEQQEKNAPRNTNRRRKPYTHPNDANLLIYPARRGRYPWAEPIELNRLGKTPTTQAQENKEKYALQELGT